MSYIRKVGGGLLAAAALLVVLLPAPVHAGVNDFDVQSFHADYLLSRQQDTRSKLYVTETIVARFPSANQNHGIERYIPTVYDGHPVRPEVQQVTNSGKQKITYKTTEGPNDYLVVRIGDADRYVHGLQTYVIRYVVHDVTKSFANHDELYWDVNGTHWRQQFGSVSATLRLDGDLADRLRTDAACYQGVEGSPAPCSYTKSKDKGYTAYTFAATRSLYAGENLTFAVGFSKNSFGGYQKTTWEKLVPLLLIGWFAAGAAVFVVCVAAMVRAWRRYGKTPKGKGTLVAEYIPPKDMSVLLASTVVKRQGPAITAQMIDLAVRHYVKLYETSTKKWWLYTQRGYEFELVKPVNTLRSEEQAVAALLFGAKSAVGKRVTLDELKAKLATKSNTLLKKIGTQAESAGYYANPKQQRTRYYWIGGGLLAVGTLVLNPGVVVGGLVVLLTTANMRPLTVQGVAARDYLKGLELYMKLAEADRLTLLQSPEGVAQLGKGVDPTDKKQLLKLYERLLPYAILFGIEKEWVKQFAALYEDQPEWYSGNWVAFNAAALTASLDTFTSASTAAFAPPSSSGSSGSSGGGSSGGGGGGGGGGGW